MSNLHALLMGVDHYFAYPLAGNLAYNSLGGCVRDINKVYGFLTSRIKMDSTNIMKLTASAGKSQPPEPPSQWPTYLNMVNAFKQLTDKVKAGDQVYIHYSGHGGRTNTMFPTLKGEGAFDEGLVPLDIGKPGDPNARYLRDVEIHNLIEALVDRKVQLTVVFDCCHSGGASRAIGGATKRGIDEPDLSAPPTDSAVGNIPDLIARWQDGEAATTRSVSNVSNWLFEPKDYTLFVACRANESAFEFPFHDQKNSGALTYWMLDTLAQSGPNTTWQMVANRVVTKVHSQFVHQTPMLQGIGNIQLFGSERLESRYGVPVLAVESGGRIRLAAGEAHGLAVGTQFAIYPTVGDADELEKRQALVELTRIGATDSWATIKEVEEGVTLESGSQAVMINTTSVRMQRNVRVIMEDTTLREAVEATIESEGKGFLALSQEANTADFLVDLHEERPDEFVLLDTTSAEIPRLRPPLGVKDEGAILKLVRRLVHLTQYRNVQTLDMPDPTMLAKLKVELESKKVNQPGDLVSLKITNNQDPARWKANDPRGVLNVTVLALSSDWSITQVYPSGAANFEPIDPGQTIPVEFDVYLPEGQTESMDTFKVFATRSATNFRWLELPPLDQPIQRNISRSVDADPLEQMLAAIGQEAIQTKAVRLHSSPNQDRAWTVAQVEMRVNKTGEEAP
ncbi:caspase family protein [Chloroflexi bacterium TSY]|nr:caspase family protein [Chloroflexi bacterium TSY]